MFTFSSLTSKIHAVCRSVGSGIWQHSQFKSQNSRCTLCAVRPLLRPIPTLLSRVSLIGIVQLPRCLTHCYSISLQPPFGPLVDCSQPSSSACAASSFSLCSGFNSLVTFEPLTVSACSSAVILLNFQVLRTA